MQPGLEKLFREFHRVFERPLPPPPSASHIPDPEPDGPIVSAMKRVQAMASRAGVSKAGDPVAPASSTAADGSPQKTNGEANGETPVAGAPPRHTENFYAEEDEDVMRASLETAVTAAIDLFQAVDKHQLSLLGANTELTGPVIERMLERYVAENMHHLLFPRLAASKRPEDLELEAKIRQMEFIDISQLGIALSGGAREKHELVIQLGAAVETFRRMTTAGSPHEMMDTLLATVKAVTQITTSSDVRRGSTVGDDDSDALQASQSPSQQEKHEPSVMTVNADTLVSLLLYVVIRSGMRNLQARLVYVRHFIFIEDVDSGEMGYALSTFEAVLAYLSRDSAGLRRASRRNKALWDAASKGDMVELRKIMEPTGSVFEDDDDDDDEQIMSPGRRASSSGWSFTNGSSSSRRTSNASAPSEPYSQGSGLSHVFPFQRSEDGSVDDGDVGIIRKSKKVSMDTRSMSSGSMISYHTRASSSGTIASGIEGDTAIERLCRTQDSFGESVPMMTIQNQRPEALRYLLSLEEYYPLDVILEDVNNEDTTLLSAAVQLGHVELIDILLDFVLSRATHAQTLAYFAKQDIWGRSVGHYLFHAPFLISRVASLVPWRQRDKNGQTPLFALCRSYDHADYQAMVDAGIAAATAAQGDGQPLHVDDHVDARGNTLLHVVNDATLAIRILRHTDVDVNATNDKKFTALMLASKYGRFDMVRALYADARVDTTARELRGLTAVELAKDDDVRNRIDDLALFAMPFVSPSSSSTSTSSSVSATRKQQQPLFPGIGGSTRITGVVRSFFVEDATIRLVLKSGAPVDAHSYQVTTCRRSLTDFEHLASLLAMEEPASWIPSVAGLDSGSGSGGGGGAVGLRSPFQIPSRPSRAVLRDVQVRMDWFLRVMLLHPTFGNHEMLWEFFLAPEIQPDMMEQRSRAKAQARIEKVREEFEPLEDIREVEQFVDHAKEMVRSLSYSTKSVARRINVVARVASGMSTDLSPFVSVDSARGTSWLLFRSQRCGLQTPSHQFVCRAPCTALSFVHRTLSFFISKISSLFRSPDTLQDIFISSFLDTLGEYCHCFLSQSPFARYCHTSFAGRRCRRLSWLTRPHQDIHDVAQLLARMTEGLAFLPTAYSTALTAYARTLAPPSSPPAQQLHATFLAAQDTIAALLSALSRPPVLVAQISAARRAAERTASLAARRQPSQSQQHSPGGGLQRSASSNNTGATTGSSSTSTTGGSGSRGTWAVVAGLLADADGKRAERLAEERAAAARRARAEADDLARELRYSQQVVAGELAGWQDLHERLGRKAIVDFARAQLVLERARLDGLRRVLRRLREDSGKPGIGGGAGGRGTSVNGGGVAAAKGETRGEESSSSPSPAPSSTSTPQSQSGGSIWMSQAGAATARFSWPDSSPESTSASSISAAKGQSGSSVGTTRKGPSSGDGGGGGQQQQQQQPIRQLRWQEDEDDEVGDVRAPSSSAVEWRRRASASPSSAARDGEGVSPATEMEEPASLEPDASGASSTRLAVDVHVPADDDDDGDRALAESISNGEFGPRVSERQR